MKKGIIGATVIVALLFIQGANAIPWGKINATPNMTAVYVERYGQGQVTLDVQYVPYYFGYLPAYVEVSVVGAPSWLTVAPNPSTFVVKPGESFNVKVAMQVSQHDIVAGTSATVELLLQARLVSGGALRQIDGAKVPIIVSYNPFTEITLRAVKPIMRTSPDKELPFTVDVVNYGNSPIIVELTLEEEPQGWKVNINPPNLKIEPKKPGDETYPYETVTITLTSPHGPVISYHNDWEDFSIRATARSEAPYWVKQGGTWTTATQDITLKNIYSVPASFLAKNRGFYIPGFDAIFMVAGLAVAALLFKRRKK